MKKREVTIRYVGIEQPYIESIRTNKEIARHYFYDWWDNRWGDEPEILDITVDGEVFNSLDDTR